MRLVMHICTPLEKAGIFGGSTVKKIAQKSEQMTAVLKLSRGHCVLKEVIMDANGHRSVNLGRLDAILKRKLDQRDTHIPRVAATLTSMPPTSQCFSGVMMLRNPHERIDLVVTMPDDTLMTLGPGQETPIPSGVKLWGTTLTYTLPYATIFSYLTEDEDMTDDDREESQAQNNWLHDDTQRSESA